ETGQLLLDVCGTRDEPVDGKQCRERRKDREEGEKSRPCRDKTDVIAIDLVLDAFGDRPPTTEVDAPRGSLVGTVRCHRGRGILTFLHGLLLLRTSRGQGLHEAF